MSKKLDLKGMVFGKLTVLEINGINKHGKVLWKCECECGNKVVVISGNLIQGKSTSCHCSKKGNRNGATHGRTGTSLYRLWCSMHNRCSTATNPNYGGRGISVCSRWNDFTLFLQDMGEKPFPNAQIDRINNNEGYSPSNCKWSTPTENSRNKRNSKMVTIQNITMCLSAWVEKTGIDRDKLKRRLKAGITGVDLLLHQDRRRSA